MTLTIRFAIGLTFLFSACRKGEAVPAYLEIPAVEVSATIEQGRGTSRITDAWVSVNDRSMGVWELPARIPVLVSGNATVTVAPGVKRNGTFDDRVRYPYYTAFNEEVDLTQEGTTVVLPTVRYESALNFWWEGFDEPGNRFNVSENSDTTLLLFTPANDPTIVLDETSCGGFVLETGRERMSIFTDASFSGAFGPVYLELDYSTDVNLTVGLIYQQNGVDRSEPFIVLIPTTTEGGVRWNKVYLDLTTFFNTSGLTQRDLYIATQLPTGRASAHVYLDNFKLVRRDD